MHTAEDDFIGSPGSLFFLPGDSTQPILITVIDDSVIENPEIFNVVLRSTDPSARIPDPISEVLIIDDNVNDGESHAVVRYLGIEFL